MAPRPSELLGAFFAAALILLAAAAVAAIAYAVGGDLRLRWVALHLALLGGVSQLVLGAAQFFTCAFLASTPPGRRFVALHLAVWNTGTLLLAVGIPARAVVMVDAGSILVALGLALFAVSLRGMQRRSLQRARWAVRWYQASAACLAGGVLAGDLLAHGITWTHGSLLGAHLAFNVAGWLGTAIVGTLHTFFPSLTGTRLRFERLQGPVLVLWVLGVVELALAAMFALDPLAAVGWLQLTAAAVLLAINLVASLRARTIPLSLATRLVALAQVFLPVGVTLALAATLVDGGIAGPLGPEVRPALAVLLLGGWIGLTVAGALMHLLAVLARVRRFALAMPTPRPARDRAVTILAGLAVAISALAQIPGLTLLDAPALVLRIAATLLIAALIVAVAVRAAVSALRAGPGGRPAGTG